MSGFGEPGGIPPPRIPRDTPSGEYASSVWANNWNCYELNLKTSPVSCMKEMKWKPWGGGGDSSIQKVGMLVENFEIDP